MDISDDDFDYSAELEKYRNVVLSACTSLGGLEKDPKNPSSEYKYFLGDECIDCLKDLKRYIRIDEMGGERLVLKWLAQWKVFNRDLVPIFEQCAESWLDFEDENDKPWYLCEEGRGDNYAIVCLCIDLFVFMTWEMDSADNDSKAFFYNALLEYKKSFCANKPLSLMIRTVTRIFETPVGWRNDKDKMILQGGLYVLRNLLGIRDRFLSSHTYGINSDNSSLQDWMIQTMDDECGLDLFIVSASMAEDKNIRLYTPIILDMFYCLYQRVNVDVISGFSSDLRSIDLISSAVAKGANSFTRPTRHNRFGGTFAGITEPGKLVPIFSASEAMKIFAKPLHKPKNVQNRKVSVETELSIKSKIDDDEREIGSEASSILRKTAISFIKSCYGSLFPPLLDDLESQKGLLDETAQTRLLYMLGYFTNAFTNIYKIQQRQVNVLKLSKNFDGDDDDEKLDFPYISQIVNQGGIGMCLRQLSDSIESANWHKTQASMYCFRSMLKATGEMSKSFNPDFNDLSTLIQSNLFYDGAVMDLMTKVSSSFKKSKQTLGYVLEMIRAVDEFIELLKSYVDQKQNVFIKKKANRKRKKTKILEKSTGESEKNIDPENTENLLDLVTLEKSEDRSLDHNQENDGDTSDDEVMYNDVKFDFDKWQKAFATQSTTNTYCIALRSCVLLKGSDLNLISKMIYRIAVTSRKPYLFYKKEIFSYFFTFLSNYQQIKKTRNNDSIWFEALSNLQDDIAYIFRQYFKISIYENDTPNPSNGSTNEAGYNSQNRSLNESLDNETSSLLNNMGDSFDAEAENPYRKKDSLLVSSTDKRRAQSNLFEDRTSFIRLKKYLDESTLGTNPNRYPPIQEELTYDSAISYDSYNDNSDHSFRSQSDNEDDPIQKRLSELKSINKELLTWNQKVEISVFTLKSQGFNSILEWLKREFDSVVVKKLLTNSSQHKSALYNSENENSEDEIENMLKVSDYIIECSDEIVSSGAFNNLDFDDLLMLLRVSKNSFSEKNKSFTISGLESLEDLKEKRDLLSQFLSSSSLFNVAGNSTKNRKKKHKQIKNNKKQPSEPKKRTRNKTNDKTKKKLGESARNIISNAHIDDTRHSISQSSELFGDYNNNNSQSSELFGNYKPAQFRNVQNKNTNSQNVSGSEDESEIRIPKTYGSSQRSLLFSDYLQSSDDDSNIVVKRVGNPITKVMEKDLETSTESNPKSPDLLKSASNFRERALEMRKRLIKEKGKKILVKKSKYDDNESEDDEY
ncbi:Topoisomerase 1-associated factor 1 [Smittium culicis]|uniref:Topoisomerase 1-associated factor 1 n=1 Tax=Smittium culicis TaxID=133412 RepID=A0A1R1YD49_9FUNG|nr:Topoisomerase 1-associated factor 1 [Smittium culicis]